MLMQGNGPSRPASRPRLPFIGNPVPSTGGIVSSLTAAVSLRVLRKMEVLGAEIILLVRQDLVSPGCVFERGFGKRRLVSRYCSQCRLGNNLLGGISRSAHSGNGGWWMTARLKYRFRWWRSLPVWLAGTYGEDGPKLIQWLKHEWMSHWVIWNFLLKGKHPPI